MGCSVLLLAGLQMESKNKIKYKKGYKYQLAETYVIQTDIFPIDHVHSEFLHMNMDGRLIIFNGYAWDGPSGPTVDTKNFMRGSLVHDALYQLIREGHLPGSSKNKADKLLKKICLEDGMSKIRAWWVFQGVDKFAGYAASPKNKKLILEAP